MSNYQLLIEQYCQTVTVLAKYTPVAGELVKVFTGKGNAWFEVELFETLMQLCTRRRTLPRYKQPYNITHAAR